MTTPSPALLARKQPPTPTPPSVPISSPTRTDVYNYVKAKYSPTLDLHTKRWNFRINGYFVAWTEVVADLLNRYPELSSRRDHPYAYVIGRLYTEHERTPTEA